MLDVVIRYAVIFVGGIVIFLAGMLAERRRARSIGSLSPQRHSSNPQALEMEQHLLKTQKPASLLGIRVHHLSGNYLALSAPLKLNTNVHGTAFAGSLYSLTVLTGYYAARSWLLQQEEYADYVLVAKSARIQYKQPIKDCLLIVARCTLPSLAFLDKFRQGLDSDAKKGYLEVSSHVNLENGGTLACECVIELCAYKAR